MFGLSFILMGQAAQDGLPGCRQPSEVARNLTSLQQKNWKAVSSAQVGAIWPSPLEEIECKSTAGCHVLVSKDRVVNGHCQCCETFNFGFDQRLNGPRYEYLKSFVMHYTGQAKPEIIGAARQIARAFGLSDDESERVGSDSVQRFQWNNKKIHQSYDLEMQFAQVANSWELYLALSADGIND